MCSSRRCQAIACVLVVAAALVGAGPAAAAKPLYIGTLGGPGHADIYPGGVDVDTSGTMYVADTGNSRIEAYRHGGLLTWSSGFHGRETLGAFDTPRDIAYLDGKLYVADLGNHRVQVLDAATGTPLSAWTTQFVSAIGISAGVAADGSPVILVAEDTKNQISEWTPSGTLIRVFGGGAAGTGDGQLAAPRDAATDPAGNVYVADYRNDRIAKFASDGTWIRNWGGSGGKDGQFRRPYGVAVDTQSRVYAADSTNHRVQIFDSNGNFLTKYGTAGTGHGQFSMLRRVAVS